MKKRALVLVAILVSTGSVSAAEKSKASAKLEATRAAIDAIAGRVGDNREAGAPLEQARNYLKKASDIQSKGRQMLGFNLGFGDLKPEAEEEMTTCLKISELAVATAASRLEKAKAASEFEAIDKQLTGVKAKIKVFEDRKAEMEKLRADAAKCQSAAKEVEALKSENSRLSAQVEKQQTEIGKLKAQMEESKKAVPEPVKSEKPAIPPVVPSPPATIPATVTIPAEPPVLPPASSLPPPSPAPASPPVKEAPLEK